MFQCAASSLIGCQPLIPRQGHEEDSAGTPSPTSSDGGNFTEMNYFLKLDAQDPLQNSIVLEELQRGYSQMKTTTVRCKQRSQQ